jgi:hypothetical protein
VGRQAVCMGGSTALAIMCVQCRLAGADTDLAGVVGVAFELVFAVAPPRVNSPRVWID